MSRWLLSLVAGLLFGVGLLISGMTRADKVFGFLDVTGDWDPALIFVMVGAIGVHAIAQWRRRSGARPALASDFELAPDEVVDGRLIAGSALFGLGWGLGGFCPGPAVVAGMSGVWAPLVFVASMLLGMALFRVWEHGGEVEAATSADPSCG